MTNAYDRGHLLILSTDLAYVGSHKRAVLAAAKAVGFRVTVAGDPGQNSPDFPDMKIEPLSWPRPTSLISAAFRIPHDVAMVKELIARLNPDAVHAMSLRPSVIAALALSGRNIPLVMAINGFGYLFQSRSVFARVAQSLVGRLFRSAGRRSDWFFTVQNDDDAAVLSGRFSVPTSQIHIARGSGLEAIDLGPPPATPPLKILMLTRLLHMKGIADAVNALQRLRADDVQAELHICGAPDPGNPSSVSDVDIKDWQSRAGVYFHGHVTDIRPFLERCHVVVQPSHGGEGLPRALLEGAAAGRALVATDVAGSRDVVVHDKTGLLVPPQDPAALATAFKKLARNAVLLEQFGEAARLRLAAEFSTKHVQEAHEKLYSRISTTPPSAS